MARPPSIKLRLARLLNKNMERLELTLESEPGRVLTLPESQAVLNMAKADALLRERAQSREEEEEFERNEKKREEAARDLVKKLTGARQANPTAKAFRGEDDTDDRP